MSTYIGPGTILGGLPVIAKIATGHDSGTPYSEADYWSEVEEIYWRKRDGSAGKPVPQHLFDKAEKYDSYFSCLMDDVFYYIMDKENNE